MLYDTILQHMAALNSIVFIFPKLLLLDIWLWRFFIIISNAVPFTYISIERLRVWTFEYVPLITVWPTDLFETSMSSANVDIVTVHGS